MWSLSSALFVAGSAAIFMVLLLFARYRDERERRREAEFGAVLRDAAKRLGFEFVIASASHADGTLEGIHVCIEVQGTNRLPTGLLVTASGTPSLDISLQAFGDGNETGDAEFDRLFRVKGDPSSYRPLLSADVRGLFVELADDLQAAPANQIAVGLTAPAASDLIVDRARSVARLARRLLENNRDLLTSWRALASSDPQPGVRAESVAALLSSYPTETAVARALLHDPDPSVRAAAARALLATTAASDSDRSRAHAMLVGGGLALSEAGAAGALSVARTATPGALAVSKKTPAG